MQYYKTKKNSNQFTKLSIASYERDTDEKPPYYQTIDGDKGYFAFCPGCDNPIKMYNLYGNKNVELDGKPQKTHARHYSSPLKDFPVFDQEAYDCCPFAKPSKFSGTSKRGQGKEVEELLNIITQHTDILFSFVRSTSNINFSEVLFEKMLTSFKEADGVYFRHVNKFNLPFSFLYMSHNQSLRYQFLFKQDINGVADSISKKSKFFDVINNQIRPKTKYNKADINIFFTDHNVTNFTEDPAHTMTLVVKESFEKETYTLLEKKIKFDNNIFYNTVVKNQRLRDMANRIFQ
jgi:hypothetical protein